MSVTCTMILGDCLDVMPGLPAGSIAMVAADLPYGNSACKWDCVFPLDLMWRQIDRVSHINSNLTFSATQPFTTTLISSKPNWFRYDLVWKKGRSSGHYMAKLRPMRGHETVLVFARTQGTYNPIFTTPARLRDSSPRINRKDNLNCVYAGAAKATPHFWVEKGWRYPSSVIETISVSRPLAIHPTQKPVALLDWLIRTYSNPGDRVLDPVSGSGTTAVAAALCGRFSVCIEKDAGYFEASIERMQKTIRDNSLDVRLEVRR